VKVGLEVHQQLATGKLFCACPSELSEEVTVSFDRRLRAAGGEERAVDPAAAFQAGRELLYSYESTPANCLVEMDEEPPRPLNEAALDVALELALLLGARPVDEVEVMRKIVVDGSNTTGFQRTALVAVGGQLEVGGRRHAIESICLEEDAARRVVTTDRGVTFRLDRLGIPLVEVATGPDITSGPEAREVAEEIGALLRSTGRARRGIGTVREDLNVSTEGGSRIEIKGVQELRKVPQYVDREVERQRALLEVRERLVARHVSPPAEVLNDVTDLVSGGGAGPLAAAARKGHVVLALPLPGFAGLLRSPPGVEERLGRELADQARAHGLGGVVHSDELPGHGLGGAEVERLRARLRLGEDDAFVLAADSSRPRAEVALRAVARRAAAALDGIPPETRDPLPGGRTRYSRPLPGRERMYPETDVPPVPIPSERLERLRASLPERPAARRARLSEEYHLPAEIARQLVASGEADRLEELVRRGRSAGLVARLLIQDLPAAVGERDDRDDGRFGIDLLDEVARAEEAGRFSKEGIPAVLAALAGGAPTLDAALERAGLGESAREDLDAVADRVVRANAPLLRDRGDAAFSPLMGDVMREVRGRRDGKEVAEAVRRSIARWRVEHPA
jgi:glutamyl-tRNA(Gln) amidotransferase subunit E